MKDIEKVLNHDINLDFRTLDSSVLKSLQMLLFCGLYSLPHTSTMVFLPLVSGTHSVRNAMAMRPIVVNTK